MRPVTLRNGLVLIVVAALLPIGTLSVVQALATLRYSQTLIKNGLVTSALATAARERDPLVISNQLLRTLSTVPAVRSGGAGCDEALRSVMGNSAALLNFARSDAAGRPLCSGLPFDRDISFAQEIWWQRGIAAPGFTVSAPVIGQISKTRILVGMWPIRAASGTNDGALTVAVDASWIERSMADSEANANAAVAIVDREGAVLLTNEQRPLPRFNVQSASVTVTEARARGGTNWMYAVAPLYGRELYIVYAEPTDVLMTKAGQQVRINLILPIVALLLASLAIWFGTDRLVLRWLESLRSLAAQYATGDFSGNVAGFARAPRELGLLSNDLHHMARAIETRDHALQSALEAKTALTHDIHHRVKNNLQIVSSLLNLQVDKIADPAARVALSQTRARIGALAQVHRLLFEESRDGDDDHVNIASLLNALCSQLRALHRAQDKVRLHCDASPQQVPIDMVVPLTLLAVEAVTNAFRHGFPDGRSGTIALCFMADAATLTMTITDDGIGFGQTQQYASMGRQLMDAFAKQLGGMIEIVSVRHGGTTVTLTIPVGSTAPESIS